MTRQFWAELLPPAILFHLFLLIGPAWPPYLLISIGALLLTLLIAAFSRSPFQDWIVLFVLFVPLEFSHPFLFFPAFSPIDYFCGASFIALGLRYRWRDLWQQLRDAYGDSALFAWYVFFIYSFLSAYLLKGNVRRTLRWDAFLFFYFVAFMAVKSADREAFFQKIAMVFTVLLGAVGIIAAGQILYFHNDYQQVTTLFHQHNSTGVFLSLCLPTACVGLLKSSSYRSLRYFLIGFGIAGFLVCGSRGAWAGLIAGVVGVILQRYKTLNFSIARKLILMTVAIISILFVLTPNIRQKLPGHFRVGLTGRQFHWQAATTILREHPWMGLGPGNYESHITEYLTGTSMRLYQEDVQFNNKVILWSHLHNFYLQTLVEYGVLGSSLLFLALGYLVRRAFSNHTSSTLWRTGFQISIIGFLVHSVVDVLTVNGFDYLLAFLLAFSHTL